MKLKLRKQQLVFTLVSNSKSLSQRAGGSRVGSLFFVKIFTTSTDEVIIVLVSLLAIDAHFLHCRLRVNAGRYYAVILRKETSTA